MSLIYRTKTHVFWEAWRIAFPDSCRAGLRYSQWLEFYPHPGDQFIQPLNESGCAWCNAELANDAIDVASQQRKLPSCWQLDSTHHLSNSNHEEDKGDGTAYQHSQLVNFCSCVCHESSSSPLPWYCLGCRRSPVQKQWAGGLLTQTLRSGPDIQHADLFFFPSCWSRSVP